MNVALAKKVVVGIQYSNSCHGNGRYDFFVKSAKTVIESLEYINIIDVVWFSHKKIGSVMHMTRKEFLDHAFMEPLTGGGTNFHCVSDFIIDCGLNPDLVLVMTDKPISIIDYPKIPEFDKAKLLFVYHDYNDDHPDSCGNIPEISIVEGN
ncbi:hypothetical protein phiOC_p059 [Ochrobactrum phage vB_OspM_OC]|nr:hypothetical protein phiOC_p059 [Ochrobactrum phage vB_OspM_OC]